MRDIDRVIERVRAALPDVRWEQLKVSHPGVDDDGIWFFTRPGGKGDVQAESSTGMCPFLVEGDHLWQRVDRATVEETASTIVEWLS
jgi:hypothetical protein